MFQPLILLVLALAPGLMWAGYLYFRGNYHAEPAQLLLRLFLSGMLISIPVIAIERLLALLTPENPIISPFWSAFVVAGLTEEFFKRWAAKGTVFHHPAFDEKLDGLIYCAFVSLGFASVENVVYVFSHFQQNQLIWMYRAFIAVPTHLMYSITMGWYLSIAKFTTDPKAKREALAKSLWMPVLLHGYYDYILMSNIPIMAFLFLPFIIWLWISNMVKLRQVVQQTYIQKKSSID